MRLQITEQSFLQDYVNQNFQQQNSKQAKINKNLTLIRKFQQSNNKIQKYGFIFLAFYFVIFFIVQIIHQTASSKQQIKISCLNDFQTCNKHKFKLEIQKDQYVQVYIKFPQMSHFDHFKDLQNDPRILQNLDGFDYPYSRCNQFYSNINMLKNQTYSGNSLENQSKAIPCGYNAAMFPYKLFYLVEQKTKTNIMINFDGFQQLNSKVLNVDSQKQWIDIERSPLFQIWLQKEASLSSFKFIGKIKGPFQGLYQVDSQNVFMFKQMKKFQILITKNNKNSPNIQTSMLYLFFSAFSLIFWLTQQKIISQFIETHQNLKSNKDATQNIGERKKENIQKSQNLEQQSFTDSQQQDDDREYFSINEELDQTVYIRVKKI